MSVPSRTSYEANGFFPHVGFLGLNLLAGPLFSEQFQRHRGVPFLIPMILAR